MANDVTSHYAIYRVEKITAEGNLAASSEHMARTRATPNADPKRATKNRVLIGGQDPEADVLALLPAVDERNIEGKLRRRTNSVLALEVMLTASPDWWQSSAPEQRREWLDQSVAWLVEEYGRENIAHLRLHQDETSPHLTGFIVPLDPESGCLNARRWTGGRGRLAGQQTSYAAAVEHLGLERGVEGSPAHHDRVKRHYGALAKPAGEIEVASPPWILINPKGWAAAQTQRLAPAAARAAGTEVAITKAKRAEAGQRAAQGRAERAEAALARAKVAADQMRALPLPDVLDALGFEEDPQEEGKWKAEGFLITVGTGAKEGKWYDHLASQGRGGAIDLAAHVMGTDFKGALAWLSDRFGNEATTADLSAAMTRTAQAEVRKAVEERPPFSPPAPAPEKWPRVRRHLIQDRALPASYIDKLHEQGDVYADGHANAVFVCRDEAGTVTGAELKGTFRKGDGSRFTGLAPGSRKELGGFRVGSMAKAATVYLVESAIDAISLMKLRAHNGERDMCVISTAGVAPEPRTWFQGISETVRRVCAFDNDEVGDDAARRLRRHRFERLRPVCKDWNDDLKQAIRDQSQAGGTETSPPAPTPDDDAPSDPFAP